MNLFRRIAIVLLLVGILAGLAFLIVTAAQAAEIPVPVAQLPDASDPAHYLIYFLSLTVTALAGFIVREMRSFTEKIMFAFDDLALEVRHGRHAVNNLSSAILTESSAREDDPAKLAMIEKLAREIQDEPELVESRARLDVRREKLGLKPRAGSRNPQGK